MKSRSTNVYDINEARRAREKHGPRRQGQSPAARCNSGSRQQESAARILVVEDDDAIRTMLDRSLTRRGFDVTFARDEREALAAVGSACPDLAIVDVRMPKLDVFTLVMRLRWRAKTAHIPVIFVSGRSDARSVAARISVGTRHYASKSSGVQTLLDKVDRVIVPEAA
jgi:DNA-binding response OmpR family regulator